MEMPAANTVDDIWREEPGDPSLQTDETKDPKERDMMPHQAPLLALPPELRNSIYVLVLVHDQPLVLRTAEPCVKEPALLATCRQIRNESRPVFYGANTLSFGPNRPFFHRLSVEQLRMMKGVICLSQVCFGMLRRGAESWRSAVKQRVDAWEDGYGGRGVRKAIMLVPLWDESNKAIWVRASELGEYSIVKGQNGKYCFAKEGAGSIEP